MLVDVVDEEDVDGLEYAGFEAEGWESCGRAAEAGIVAAC